MRNFFSNGAGTSDYSYIKRSISRYPVISFDIFDTLLKRNVRHPKDIFILVEREAIRRFGNLVFGFSDKRVFAEQRSRCISEYEEVTINEIYRQLPYEEEIKSILLQMELDIEYALITPNKEMKEVYEYAISLGKEVLLVSDMYLSKNFIERLLRKCGYQCYKNLYVSSDTKVSKSTGHMYKLILNKKAYKVDDILHIGDSGIGDYIWPRIFGFKAILIKTHVDHLLYTKDCAFKGINYSLLYSFINNTVSGNRLFQIGYETLGPLLYGFCVWLHEQKTRLNLDQLLFFSRDGQIIYKAYKLLYPNDLTDYIYVSRRSVIVPFINFYDSLEKIFDKLPLNRYLNLSSLFEALGLNYADYIAIINKYGLNTEFFFTKKQILDNNKLKNLLMDLDSDIRENSRNEYIAFKQYIQSLGLRQKVGIVDIGWTGRMQSALEKIISSLYNDSIEIHGFYFGISTVKENMSGYLFNSPSADLRAQITGYVGFFETLFSANHGSVKKYRMNFPVELYDFEYDKNEYIHKTYEDIMELQSGALSFVEHFYRDSSSNYLEWNLDLSFSSMNALGTNPRYKDLICMGDWFFLNNNRLYRLAHPSYKSYYNIFFAKRELYMSYWKIAYLKRFLKVPLPYLKIYRLLNRLFHQE